MSDESTQIERYIDAQLKLDRNPTRTVQQAVDLLNEALEIDREAIETLFSQRVAASKALGEHPTIQILTHPGGERTLGVLGLLNGIFGVDAEQWGFIASCHDDETDRLIKFIVRDPQKNPIKETDNGA